MLDKRRIIVIIGTLLVVVMIVVAFSSVFLPPSQPKSNVTPTPGAQVQATVTPPAITYDKEKRAKAAALLAHKEPLPLPEQALKEALSKETNPLHTSSYVFISYVPKQDAFQAEIHTMKINTAKDETIAWFRSKGFSEESICNLPVIFSINRQNAEKLRAFDIVFSPLAPGC
ncbi:MAG: hypothetical protein AAB553_05590 [Patescibacteria group bacterium]